MGGNDQDGYSCTLCGGIPPDKITPRQILVDGKATGIDKLDWILAEVRNVIPAHYAFRFPIRLPRDFIHHIGKSPLTVVQEQILIPDAPSVPTLPVTRNFTQLWRVYKIVSLAKYTHFRDFAKRGAYRAPFSLIGARSKPGLPYAISSFP
jgi:hypothetical protein